MTRLPLFAIEKLMKEKGALRVSDDAKKEMIIILEEYLESLAIKASKISSHSGRKTINGGDLKIAEQ